MKTSSQSYTDEALFTLADHYLQADDIGKAACREEMDKVPQSRLARLLQSYQTTEQVNSTLAYPLSGGALGMGLSPYFPKDPTAAVPVIPVIHADYDLFKSNPATPFEYLKKVSIIDKLVQQPEPGDASHDYFNSDPQKPILSQPEE